MGPIECKRTIWRGPLKQIIITPIIKKASLDPNELKQTTDLYLRLPGLQNNISITTNLPSPYRSRHEVPSLGDMGQASHDTVSVF